MLKVRLSTRCFPTEDRDKVVRAIGALFPDASVVGDEDLTAESSSLEVFSELLKRQRIRDAARAVMLRGKRDNSTHFRLNKQVAAVGKISFSGEAHPLGDIDVVIESDDILALIGSIAPDTRKVKEH